MRIYFSIYTFLSRSSLLTQFTLNYIEKYTQVFIFMSNKKCSFHIVILTLTQMLFKMLSFGNMSCCNNC